MLKGSVSDNFVKNMHITCSAHPVPPHTNEHIPILLLNWCHPGEAAAVQLELAGGEQTNCNCREKSVSRDTEGGMGCISLSTACKLFPFWGRTTCCLSSICAAIFNNGGFRFVLWLQDLGTFQSLSQPWICRYAKELVKYELKLSVWHLKLG